MPAAPTIEIAQGDWQPLEGEGILLTKGIATCIGVSLYDIVEKRAILGHFDDKSLQDGAFGSMIQAAHRDFSVSPQTRVWVGGGALLDPELTAATEPGISVEIVELANNQTQLFREKVLRSVADFTSHGATLGTFWLQGTVYHDYSLNVGTGEEHVTINSD